MFNDDLPENNDDFPYRVVLAVKISTITSYLNNRLDLPTAVEKHQAILDDFLLSYPTKDEQIKALEEIKVEYKYLLDQQMNKP